MQQKNTVKIGFGIVLVMMFVFSFYVLHKRVIHLQDQVASVHNEVVVQSVKNMSMDNRSGDVIERIVSSAQLWRPIQEHISDTVAQVFVQLAVVDLLQPFKTPAQGVAYGSGFFINAEGDFVTNAHVVYQAKTIYVQIPSLGKRIIDMEVIGICPDRDLALLRMKPESKKYVQSILGSIPYLPLGNSDSVHRSDEVLALGYPLGMHSLKSTTGVVSGFEHHLIQISAAINPGNSGGPLLNGKGEVIGINNSAVLEAQNVGYAIPVNDLKIILPDLYNVKILRKPVLGILFNNGNEALTELLNNPVPGGTYIVEVIKNSILDRAGIKQGDMIYEINGHTVDMFGEMSVPWNDDKISISDYVSGLSIGDKVTLTVYRKGERKDISINFELSDPHAIRKVFPAFEPIDYEIFAGMVVMELTINHVQLLMEQAGGLAKFAELKNQGESVLLVTHIFPNSQVFRARILPTGSTINEVNGIRVNTLAQYREAIKKGASNRFFTVLASDNVSRASDDIFVVLYLDKVLDDERQFAHDYKYQLGSVAQELLEGRMLTKAIKS